MASRTSATVAAYTTEGSTNGQNIIHAKAANLESRQRETAQYIADMILELRNLAKSAKLFHVMAPLEFAYYESYSAANRVEPPEGEVEHIRELSKISSELEAIPLTKD